MSHHEEEETVSLDPRYRQVAWEFDRTFQKHSLDEGIYFVPVDEDEEERLKELHEIMLKTYQGNLFARFEPQSPKKILDCGSGQAHWAIAVAQEYPECEVTALDIWPIDLSEEADYLTNLSFEVDNLNHNLLDGYRIGTFDIIHSRFVGPGIHKNRWPSYVEELVKLLKPGGCLLMMEMYFNFQSDTGSLKSGNALYRWGELYRSAMERDRNPRVGTRNVLSGLMNQAGLESVDTDNISLPIGNWPQDEEKREIGILNLSMIDKFLASFGTYPFRGRLGLSKEVVDQLYIDARAELRRPDMHAYLPMEVSWGIKPQLTRRPRRA